MNSKEVKKVRGSGKARERERERELCDNDNNKKFTRKNFCSVPILFFVLFQLLMAGCLKEKDGSGKEGGTDVSSALQSSSLDGREVKVQALWIISPKLSHPSFEGVRGYIPEYALLICSEGKIEDNFLVDSFVSVKGGYGGDNMGEEGNVGVVAGTLKVEGGVIKGDIILGERATLIEGEEEGDKEEDEEGDEGEHSFTITGDIIRGEVMCPDFSPVFSSAEENNDNSLIPSEFLDGGSKLKLEGGDVLELPSGVYYLRGLKLEGGSELRFSGIAFLFVDCFSDDDDTAGDKDEGGSRGKGEKKGKKRREDDDCFKLEGGSRLGNFPDLRVFVRGSGKLEGGSELWGFLWVRDGLKVEDEGEIYGGVVASKFKGENNGAIHRAKDISAFWTTFGDKKRRLILDFRRIIISGKLPDEISDRFNIRNFSDIFGTEVIPSVVGGGR